MIEVAKRKPESIHYFIKSERERHGDSECRDTKRETERQEDLKPVANMRLMKAGK